MSDPFWVTNPPTWRPTDGEYYRGVSAKAIGSSALARFRDSRLGFHRWINGALDDDPSEAMVLGSLVDCLLTTPGSEAFRQRFVIASKRGLRSDGRHDITSAMYEKARGMAGAVEGDEVARRLFMGPGLSQACHLWTDQWVTMPEVRDPVPLVCRGRWDRLVEMGGEPVNVELKSWLLTGDRERAVASLARKREVAEQAAHFERASDDLGWRVRKTLLVIVNSGDAPEVLIRQLSEERMEAARARVAEDLRDMARCMETGDFRSTCEGEIKMI